MKILTRLELIASKESFVLLDGSVARLSQDKEDDLFTSFYTIDSYRQIPMGIFRKEMNSWRSFDYCMRQENVWTIREVYQEIKRCVQIMADKHDFFENHVRAVLRIKKSRSWRFLKEYDHPSCIEKEYFEELELLVENASRQVRNSLFVPGNRKAYSLILDMVCLLSEAGNLKKEHRYICDYYDPNSLAPKPILKTDEKLVASALYRSLVELKESAVVCRDMHFGSLLAGCRHIFAKDMPFQDDLLGRFLAHPITLYDYQYVGKMFRGSSGFALIKWIPRQFNILGANNPGQLRNQVSNKLGELAGLLGLRN